MLNGIQCLGHSTIKISKSTKVIYIDPFKIKEKLNDADIIFVTHSHYDHFSPDDIEKVKNENTIIVVTDDLYSSAQEVGFNANNIITVKPYEEFEAIGIQVSTIPAYNTNKKFHPKDNKWVGYILTLDGVKYYIAGDTDINEDNRKAECDVAFVPVGGTYTMTATEAAELINEIKPKIAVPIHYGSIVGTRQDAEDFVGLLEGEIIGDILIK